jgi:hypothetical protein
MARKPQVVLSFVDAADFDKRYGVIEQILKEMGKIPDANGVVDRIRVLGSELVTLESPCFRIAESVTASDETRRLAQDVIGQVEDLRHQVAALIVDLTQAQKTVQIVNGASE